MTPDSVVLIAQQALEMILVMVLLLLLPALVVGLLISMFQAATQINEATLSFIPKLAVTLATILLAGPWIVRTLVDYTQNLIESIPYLIG
jgi:flagellar biosynthetic protein FliQ